MAYTTTQLQAVEDAIATGELTVEFDGKRITYRSMAELVQARNLIRAELMSAGTISTEPRVSYVNFSKD